MKKRLFAVLLATALVGTMVVGCGSSGDGESKDSGKGSEKITIGVTMKDNSDEFVKRIANEI